MARPRGGRSAKSGTAPSASARDDLSAKVLVRKRAPFVIEEQFRGDSLRINKDGTFAKEGELTSFNSQGKWKVKGGRLVLKWNTGEEYGLGLKFSGKTPVLEGQRPVKGGRYVLKSQPTN